jgi:hypothetical protein
LDLTEQEDGTEMAYKGIGNLNGPLASLGQRLVDTVGRQFIDQGANIFAREIESRVAVVTGEPVHVEPPAPYGTVFQTLILFVVLAAIAILVGLLVVQSWPH